MKAFLNPHSNGPSLTGITDVTAHRISLFQENEPPKNINDIFMPKSDISVAEPYGVQVAELVDNSITMYQFIRDINDTKVGGLESLSIYIYIYIYENFFSKDDPAINGHRYHLIKNNTMKRYMIFTMSVKENI